MTEQIKPDRKVILTRSRGRQFERKFFLEIQEAFDEGYRIAETDLLADESLRMFQGNSGRVVMYKEGTAPEKWVPAKVEAIAEVVEPPKVIVKEEGKATASGVAANTALTPIQELDALTKVKQLKEFAEKHTLVIPEEVTNPKAIKKVLKALLEA